MRQSAKEFNEAAEAAAERSNYERYVRHINVGDIVFYKNTATALLVVQIRAAAYLLRNLATGKEEEVGGYWLRKENDPRWEDIF